LEAPLFILTFGLACATWLSADRGWAKTRLLAKPATLIALIAWFSLAHGWQGGDLWFGLALVFSLVGDILLELPERYFLSGLVAFLAAQILYTVAFNQSPLAIQPLALVIVALVALIGARLFLIIRGGLVRTNAGRKMVAPVAVYSLAISLMLISAWLCLFRPGWPLEAALLVGVGALLFFTSDSVLAYTRFVGKIPHHDLLVMSTYHLGQIAIIAGVILRP
jgi:uncharacterized membrane protein YhhN